MPAISASARVLAGLLAGAALGVVLTRFAPALAADFAAVTRCSTVETIPDAFATIGNVTGDLAATTVVGRRNEGQAKE